MTVNHLLSEIPEAGMGVNQHGADLIFFLVSFLYLRLVNVKKPESQCFSN